MAESSRGVVCAPKAATCNGKVYDFFVIKRQFEHAAHSAQVVCDAALHPHSPARLYLKAAPRSIKIRRLKAPRKIAAELPFGPVKPTDMDKAAGDGETVAAAPPHPADRRESGKATERLATRTVAEQAHEGTMGHASDGSPTSDVAVVKHSVDFDLDKEYGSAIRALEAELLALEGIDPGQTSRLGSRADGPTFVWQAPDVNTGTHRERGNPVARAWRNTANWAKALLRSSPGAEKDAAERKILRHDHRLGGLVATQLKEEAALFERWRALITVPMLRTVPTIMALAEAAKATADRVEHEAEVRARREWHMYLNEGPARGLRRQHAMSKTATGWIPTPIGRSVNPLRLEGDPGADEHGHQDDDDDIDGEHMIIEAAISGGGDVAPLDVQQSVEAEAIDWARQWATEADYPLLQWGDIGELPPLFLLQTFKRALMTFPAHTGLGWDAIHPRALLRASDKVLLAIMKVIMICELVGRWPGAVSLLVVVLLPKPEGGRRPIGLLPLLPRVWMRARREIAYLWERACDRPFLYAGPARGAQVAAWRQAARAELAAAADACYGQVLLDLVKAFERIPHARLVHEARRLGYPLWLLRLSIATYRLGRTLRLDGAWSVIVRATRGIVAGSGFATSEMRLVMIHIVDSARALYRSVVPSLYVDDLSAEAVAKDEDGVVRAIVPFTDMVCRLLEDDGLEVSRKKSICAGSSDSVGKRIADGLSAWGIAYHRRVKSLGAGLGGGRRRNAKVQEQRHTQFRKRLVRLRKLKRAGVSTTRLLRTGGADGMKYGQAIVGVSLALLLRQRRAVAAAAAPAGGASGQQLDLALVLEDGLRGRMDPAFEAHAAPIGQWALAAWEGWLNRSSM